MFGNTNHAWERDAAPALNHINLEGAKGQLVGAIGTGKSSLLTALPGGAAFERGQLTGGHTKSLIKCRACMNCCLLQFTVDLQ